MSTKRRLIGSAVALAVLGAGGYGFWQQYPATKISRACSGMLPVGPALDLTDQSRFSLLGIHFDVSSGQYDGSFDVTEPPGLTTSCRLGTDVDVRVETAVGAHNAYAEFTDEGSDLPIPLNAGWQGFMTGGEEGGTAVTLLTCKNWSAQQGSGLLVTAGASFGDQSGEEGRLDLARVVTGTAQRAAEQTGCETDFGDADELTAPATDPESVPADKASGTCEGTTSAGTVRETAAGTSPVEGCELSSSLRLTAEYGPFSDASEARVNGKYGGHDTPSGTDRTEAWTTATCEGALGTGYYHASPAKDSDRDLEKEPLTQAERADLAHFAEESAARHGCETPAALPSA